MTVAVRAAGGLGRLRTHPWPIAGLLGAGLGIRLVLALVAFPDQGLSTDLGLFGSWASTLASTGPGSFYANAASANYPPGYLFVLWLVGSLGGGVALLKLPAILADIAIGALLYRAGRRWFGTRVGLIAAALYLFVPVTWYESALWGEVDAVGTLVMLAAIVLLVEGWSEPALALAALAVTVKPQDAVVLVVVLPVLLRRHLFRIGSGPRPRLGPALARLDARLGGLLSDQGPVRLVTSTVVAVAAVLLVLVPFDITRFAPASLSDVPLIGHLAGLVGLFASVTGQYSVLTANAFNAWALVGASPLASAFGAGGGSWTSDSTLVLGGIPAATLGTVLLVATGLLVAVGLLRRDGPIPILLGFALVAFAFYALPTRVHERYLLPFFAPGALLAAIALPGVAAYVGVALLNTANLHAIVGAATSVGFFGGSGVYAGRAGGAAGGGSGSAGGGFRAGSIQLPFADLLRSEPAIAAVAIGQTAAFLALLVAWLVLIARPAVSGPAQVRYGRLATTMLGSPSSASRIRRGFWL